MGSSDAGCTEATPFRIEPHFGQGAEYLITPPVKEAWNILQEYVSWFHLANDPGDVTPYPSLVLCSLVYPGIAPGLAGETGRDDIHSSTPRAAIEGFNVIPDRSFIQEAVSNTGRQNCCAISFPLRITDAAIIFNSESESKFEASNPGT